MLNVYLSAFTLGVEEELLKKAFDAAAMPSNENILPNISNQTKWKYVRTKDGLKLSDGNLVYSFSGFPEEYSSEDIPVSRLKDDNILDFEKDMQGKGTAQIHRSSPDNIYMTLADGASNPTFMLQHEQGQTWRYTPSKKFLEKLKQRATHSAEKKTEVPEVDNTPEESALLLDPESLLKGAADLLKKAFDPMHPTIGMDSEDIAQLIQRVGYGARDLGNKAIDTLSEHPVASGSLLLAAAQGASALKDRLNPENAPRTDPERAYRTLGNAGAAALPVLAARAIRAE